MKKSVAILFAAAVATLASTAAAALRWRAVEFADIPEPASSEIATDLRRATGGNVEALSCGSIAGISPSVKVAYGCSGNGQLCYANIGHNGELVSSGCGACGGTNEPDCTPWER